MTTNKNGHTKQAGKGEAGRKPEAILGFFAAADEQKKDNALNPNNSTALKYQ